MLGLPLISVVLMLTGCVAVPVYDYGYYYPDYGAYPYAYVGFILCFFNNDLLSVHFSE